MTQEDKKLLLKDLSARLPYRVRCKCINGLGGGETDHGVLKFIGNCNGVISNYYEDIPIDSGFVNNVFYPIENIKPYLRPPSSIASLISAKEFSMLSGVELIDWYNANHIDYRGLIEKGLALEASEIMYN